MATYQELYNLRGNSDLINKITVALVIAAEGLIAGTPTDAEKAWILKAISNPVSEATRATNLILAKNAGLTVAQIEGATDAVIQTQVDAIVPVLTFQQAV